jgi:hypothetical protein
MLSMYVKYLESLNPEERNAVMWTEISKNLTLKIGDKGFGDSVETLSKCNMAGYSTGYMCPVVCT